MPTRLVYALVGADSFLQLQALAQILSELPPDVQRIDLDGERAELADVLDELRSFSMFGGGKLVVVRDAGEFLTRYREQLEDYVAKPSDGSVLVLRFDTLPKTQRIYKAIVKSGQIVECEPPSSAEISRWVLNRARTVHKITLTPDAAELLRELLGTDLGRLDNEIAKLALDADPGKPVGTDKISGTVSFQREQEMWDMTNEMAMGRAAEALKRWRQLLQLDPSAEYRAITWLGMWLEDVGTVLSSKRGRGPGTGKLSWKYKNRLPQFIKNCEAIGAAGHARALDLLALIDQQSKTGVGDAATNVERFILDMAPATAGRR